MVRLVNQTLAPVAAGDLGGDFGGEPVDAALFRAAFRQLSGGVSIVTAGEGAGRTGLTVTSVTSFSSDPATLLVCVNRTASAFPVIEREGHFGVAFLGAGQQPIADRFAGRGGVKGADRFAGAEWTVAVTGAPLLVGALATLDCTLEEIIPRGSHAIVLGRVRAVRLGNVSARALAYWRGDYVAISEAVDAGRVQSGLSAF